MPVRTETLTQRVVGGRFACAVGSTQDDRAREQQRKLYRRSFERGELPSVPTLAESVRVHVPTTRVGSKLKGGRHSDMRWQVSDAERLRQALQHKFAIRDTWADPSHGLRMATEPAQ